MAAVAWEVERLMSHSDAYDPGELRALFLHTVNGWKNSQKLNLAVITGSLNMALSQVGNPVLRTEMTKGHYLMRAKESQLLNPRSTITLYRFQNCFV